MGGSWIRLDDHRMSRQLLYGELWAGKRKKNRPRKGNKDTVKVNFRWCDILSKELEAAASDKSHWRLVTHTASTSFEDERLMAAYERRHRASSAEITTTEVQYPHLFQTLRFHTGFTEPPENPHIITQLAVFFGHKGQPPTFKLSKLGSN